MKKTIAAGALGGFAAFLGIAFLIAASTAWGDFIAIPRGTSAGDTGRVRWRELAANGSHSVDWKATDSLAATNTYTWPGAYPAGNGYSLTSTTAGVTSWTNISGGGAGSSGSCGEPTCLDTVPSTGWTSENFAGTTSIDTTDDLHVMTETTNSANIRARYRTAPSPPYVCAADFMFQSNQYSQDIWLFLGQRESSTGEWAMIVLRSNISGGAYTIDQVAAPTFTEFVAPGPWSIPPMAGKIIRLATRDDNTNREFGFIDSNWNFWVAARGTATQTRTTTLTADQVGWGLYNNGGSAGDKAVVTLIGWECR